MFSTLCVVCHIGGLAVEVLHSGLACGNVRFGWIGLTRKRSGLVAWKVTRCRGCQREPSVKGGGIALQDKNAGHQALHEPMVLSS